MNKFNLLLFILFSVFSFNRCLFGQNTGGIKGFVVDSTTKEPVPYATIRVMQTKLGTSADSKGFYFLQNIPCGNHTIEASAIGYRTIKTFISIEQDAALNLKIILSPSPVELQAVIKTTDRIKEVYETNISVHSISQDELKLLPSSVEQDIFKAFKLIPGISTTSDVTGQFYVRGGGGDQNLILLDNMMVYNPFHALGLFSIFNSEAIKTAEIMTAGFGPEFGGRLSSVVNLVAKEGNSNQFSGKLNFGILSGQGILEGPSLDGSFMLSFRKSYLDKILKKFVNKDLPLSFYDFVGKVTYDVSENGKLYFTGLMSNDEISNSSLLEPNFSWNNNAFGISFFQTFSDRFVLNMSFSKSFFRAVMDPKNRDNLSNSVSQISDSYFNAKADVYLDNNDLLSFGMSYLLPQLNNEFTNTAGFLITRFNPMSELIFWLKYKWKVSDNLIIETGLRSNFTLLLDQPDYALEPRISFVYKFSPDFSVKGSYGRHHQTMVTTSNEDEVIPLFETWIPINSPFNPERCDQYVLGIESSPANNLNISMQGYYKRFTNLLAYNLDKVDYYDSDFSSGTGNSYGFETLIKYQSGIFFAWLSYTLSWANKTNNGITYPPRYDKRHNFNMFTTIKLPENIDLSLNWEISSGSPFSQIASFIYRPELNGLFNNNYLNESGELYSVLGSKNNARLPMYHRLDLNISKYFDISGLFKFKTMLDIINVYDHKNILYYDRSTGNTTYMLPFLISLSLGVEL